jgi:photosystem II stability/assembly factor-like uncharacterized protein
MKSFIYVSILLLISNLSASSQTQSVWKHIGSPTGGSIKSIIEKDGYLFTAAGEYWSTGAVYRSDDNGLSWKLKIKNLPADFTVLSLTSNANYIFAGSSGGVYRTSNYGESWESSNLQAVIYTVHANGNNIYAGGVFGIYRSADQGNSWQPMSAGLGDNEVYVMTTTGNYTFAGTSDGVYRSLNGSSWQPVNSGIVAQFPYVYSLLYYDGKLFTGMNNETFVSSNFGNTWTNITNGTGGAYSLKESGNKIYKTNYYGIHYSTNYGQSWTTINNSPFVNQYLMDIHVKDNLIITGDTELNRSTDHGNNWSFSSSGIANLSTGPIIKWQNALYTTADNIIYKSVDNGLTWNTAAAINVYARISDFFVYQNYLFGASGSGKSVRTADGITWEEITVNSNRFVALGNYLFAQLSGYTGVIFRSSDAGTTWEDINTPLTFFVSDIAVYQGELYIGGALGLFKSNDNGTNWTQVNYTSAQDQSVRKLFAHNNYLILIDENENFYRTSNGTNWEFIQNNLQNTFYSTFHSFGNILFGTAYNYGVIVSYDNGTNWISMKEGLPANSNGNPSQVSYVYADENQLFASVPRFSIWQASFNVVPVELTSFTAENVNDRIILSWATSSEINNSGFEIEKSQISNLKSQIWEKIGFVTGNGTTSEQKSYSFTDENLSAGKYQYRLKQIDLDGSFEYSQIVEVDVAAPLVFYLEQNYPNPFNPSTTIKYSIPTSEFVTLKVYDMLGSEVATLVNEEKPVGSYEFNFSAEELSTGIYFYKLQAGGFIETKKMILLR